MIWVTASRPGLDALASAWLIRRRLDGEARFVFVPAEHVGQVARVTGGYAFDILGGDYPPRVRPGDQDVCTFEVLLAQHGLQADPALSRLAEAVSRADAGAAAGDDELAVVLAGFVRRSHEAEADDHTLLAQAMPLLDTLTRQLAGVAA